MNFHKTDLQYYIDYDYRRSSCHCDEDICRCTTIEETWVNDIDVNKVIQRLYSIHRTPMEILTHIASTGFAEHSKSMTKTYMTLTQGLVITAKKCTEYGSRTKKRFLTHIAKCSALKKPLIRCDIA